MKSYDYIIVGFGPTSSTLIYSLGRDPNVSVLVLEIGTNELNNSQILDPYGVFTIQNSPNICETLITNSDFASYGTRLQLYRGTTWGGGSSVNYQVYDRGSRFNWDQLRPFNPFFDYDYLLNNFWKKVENYSCTGNPVDPQLHGFSGNYYQHVSTTTPITMPLAESFLNVLNIPFSTDSNANLEDGTFNITENQDVFCTRPDVFQRSTFTLGYTQSIVNKPGGNVRVKSGCLVDRVEIDPRTQKARGVHYISSKGCYEYAAARKAVILGAGSLGTPPILQRSGIGPAPLLESLKIPVAFPNANVGANLNIQYGFTAVFLINKKVYDQIVGGPENYLQTAITAYFATNQSPRQGYIHILSAAVLASQPALVTQIQASYDPEKYGAVTALCWDLYPKTTGSVKITSRAPTVPFDIEYNAFSNSEDLTTGRFILTNLKKVIEGLTTTPSGDPIDAQLIFPPPETFTTDETMNAFLQSTAYVSFHYYQSCRIGADASTGVVDGDLHVHGIKNLVVSDNSVLFDQALGAGPSGQLTAMGYATASIIKKRYGDGNLDFSA